MSRTSDLAGFALLPFALGAAAATLLHRPSAPPAADAPTRVPPREPFVSEVTAPRGAPPAEPAIESRSCGELEEELARLEGLVEEWYGEASPWPDEPLDPRIGEPGFSAWMDQVALEVASARVVEVDCSHYPCVGLWRVEDLDPGALMERAEELGDVKVSLRMLPIPDAEGGTSHWIVAASAYAPGTVDPAMTSLRMNAALSANGWYEPLPPDGG